MLKSLSSKTLVLFISLIIFSCTKDKEPTAPTVSKFQVVVAAQDGGAVSSAGGTYESGKEVTITATPNDGFQFAGWEGTTAAQANTNPLTIKVSANVDIKATFTPTQYALKLIVVGEGQVSQETINLSSAKSTETIDKYKIGSVVRLNATPKDGWIFYRWSGGSTSTIKQTDIVIDKTKTVTATFEKKLASPDMVNVDPTGLNIIGKWKVRGQENKALARGADDDISTASQSAITELTFRSNGSFSMSFNNLTSTHGVFNFQKNEGASLNIYLTVANESFGTLLNLTLTNNYMSFNFSSKNYNNTIVTQADRDRTYKESEDPNAPPVQSCNILTSLVEGPQTQTVTGNDAIKTVSYSFNTTCVDLLSASVTGLPSGVTMAFNENKAVISGTPTGSASGTYNYALTIKSATTSTTVVGVVNVNVICSVSAGVLTSGPQTQTVTKTIGEINAIATTTYTFSSNCNKTLSASVSGLPSGVTMSFNNNQATISGVIRDAVIGGTYKYVITVKDSSTATSVTGFIIVGIPPCESKAVKTSGPLSQTVSRTFAIEPITYSFSSCGDPITTVAADNLPPGITISFKPAFSQAVISGIPTSVASGTYNYTITVGGSSIGGDSTGSITITGCGVSLASSTLGVLTGVQPAQNAKQTIAIKPIIYTFSSPCNKPLYNSKSPNLPTGLNYNFSSLTNQASITGVLPSSVPVGVYDFAVTITDGTVSKVVSGSINLETCAVTGVLTSGGQSQTVSKSFAITPVVYTFSSDCAKSLTVTTTDIDAQLPSGVTASFDSTNNRVTISGTVSASVHARTYTYYVTAVDSDGNSSNRIAGNIDVNGCKILEGPLLSGQLSQTVLQGARIATTTYSFSSNCAKTLTATATDIIPQLPPGIYGTYNRLNNSVSVYGKVNSLAPAKTYEYGVVIGDGTGNTRTVTGTIVVKPCKVVKGTVSGQASQTVLQGTQIATTTYNFSSICSKTLNANITSINRQLPPGVVAKFENNSVVISGKVVSNAYPQIYTYGVTVSDAVTSTTVTGTIIVNACKVSGKIVSGDAQTVFVGSTMATTTFEFSSICSTTLTAVFSNRTYLDLPYGIRPSFDTANNRVTVAGTIKYPSVAKTYKYGVLVRDANGNSTTVTGTIIVDTCRVVRGTVSGSAQTVVQGVQIAPATYDFSSNCTKTLSVDLASIDTQLPAGVTAKFDSTTNRVTVSGTVSPTAVAKTYTYYVKVTDTDSISDTVTGTIVVEACKVIKGTVLGDTQTVIRGFPMAPATYKFSSNCTKTLSVDIATINAQLPSGVAASFANNTVTVSGTVYSSAVAQTYKFGVVVTDSVGNSTTVTGTVIVDACKVVKGTVSAGVSQTVVQGAQIVTTTYDFSSNCTKTLSADFSSISNQLPYGLARSFDSATNRVTISGKVASFVTARSYEYGVIVKDTSGNTTTVTGTIVVEACKVVKGAVSAGASQTVVQGAQIAPANYDFSSNCSKTLTSNIASINNGQLPSGITASFANNRVTVSGTVASTTPVRTYEYPVTVTDSSGNSTTVTGTIVVEACKVVSGALSAGASQTVGQGVQITPATYDFSSNCAKTLTANINSINGQLPTGVTANFANNRVTVSGTVNPLATAQTYKYGVIVNDTSGNSDVVTGTIAVKSCSVTGVLTSASGTNSQTVSRVGGSFPEIIPVVFTFTPSYCSGSLSYISDVQNNRDLPAGVTASFDSATNAVTISGRPTINYEQTLPYSVTVGIAGGMSVTVTGVFYFKYY